MKKKIRLIAILLFLFGLLLFLYPYYYEYKTNRNINVQIENFEEFVKQDSDIFPYKELYEAMKKYNEELYLSGQSKMSDQLNYENPDFFLADYGIEDEVYGYVEIPKLDVKLPIFNGASEENMSKGAVYLSYTSLPVGGANTNTCIAAHLRHKGVDMFRYLIDLQDGDDIYLTNFWETLHYKVIANKVIKPEEVSNIYIQEGEDLLTLSTCHPYPESYERYLVFASHVK